MRESLEELQRVHDRQLDHFSDALPRHQDRQTFRLEAPAFAGGAGLLDHVLLELDPHRIAGALPIAPGNVGENAFPLTLVVVSTAPLLDGVLELSPRCPVQQRVPSGLAVGSPGRREIELEGLGEGGQHDLAEVAGGLSPGQHHSLENRDAGIAQHQIGIHLASCPDSVALGTGAEG